MSSGIGRQCRGRDPKRGRRGGDGRRQRARPLRIAADRNHPTRAACLVLPQRCCMTGNATTPGYYEARVYNSNGVVASARVAFGSTTTTDERRQLRPWSGSCGASSPTGVTRQPGVGLAGPRNCVFSSRAKGWERRYRRDTPPHLCGILGEEWLQRPPAPGSLSYATQRRGLPSARARGGEDPGAAVVNPAGGAGRSSPLGMSASHTPLASKQTPTAPSAKAAAPHNPANPRPAPG